VATSDRQRTRLIELLWHLKTEFSRNGESNIQFNTLVNDPDYREDILNKAVQSGTTHLREIAQQIKELDIPGRLVPAPGSGSVAAIPNDEKPQSEPKAAIADQPSPTPPEPKQSKSYTGRIVTSAVVVAIAIIIVVLRYSGIDFNFFNQAFNEMLGKQRTVSGVILESTLWRASSEYFLEGIVYVGGDAKLTIEPGTKILGRPGSALVIARDATIDAKGTASKPIVFTSAQPEGSRSRGDWGGLVLLGNAPINRGRANIEGIPEEEGYGSFGGSDSASNCGILEYVRVEFAGFEIGANNELNGLTLGGCGDSTIIRHVQSHMGLDDGIEVFGGTVDLRNVVVSGARDDSFDWDMGWNGRVQFLVIKQFRDEGDNGFEGDNWKNKPDAQPRSAPTFYNVTMVGSDNPDQDQRAMVIRRGSGGTFRNFIITGFPLAAIDIRDKETAALIETGELSFENMLFHKVGRFGRTYFPGEIGEADNDGGFDEDAYFTDPIRNNRFNVDPRLPYTALGVTDSDSFTPGAKSPAAEGAASVPTGGGVAGGEFWDQSANYLGAVRPGVSKSWLAGWTAFPPN